MFYLASNREKESELVKVTSTENVKELKTLAKFIKDQRLYQTKYLQKFTKKRKEQAVIEANQAKIRRVFQPDGDQISTIVGVLSRNSSQIRDLKSHKMLISDKFGNPVMGKLALSRNAASQSVLTQQTQLGIKVLNKRDLNRLNCSPSPDKYQSQVSEGLP